MRNWNLLKELEQLHREIDDVFHGAGLGQLFGQVVEPGYGSRGYPRINLREDADHVYVEALLPGIDPQHVEMNMLGNTLTLSGERSAAEQQSSESLWHRRERGTGTFLRTIELPVDVDVDKIKAESRHGLLRVTLPKAPAAKPKKISIKTK